MSTSKRPKRTIEPAERVAILMDRLAAEGVHLCLPWNEQGATVADSIVRASRLDGPVLVHGETGVGKELVANAIQLLSNRAGKTFKKLNCVSVESELIASELFGHVKGAFTGAVRNRVGFIESASGGYLHLDEIGDISQSLQGMLLRVFENKEYYRVGDTTRRTTDVRFILTTNKPLERLREDLRHRMAETIYLPPIRNEWLYICQLFDFLLDFLQEDEDYSLNGLKLSLGAIAEVVFDSWPGNVRKLQAKLKECTQKVSRGLTSDQESFMKKLQLPYNDRKAIYTFRLEWNAEPLGDLPVTLYTELVPFSGAGFRDGMIRGWRVLGRLSEERRELEAKLTGQKQAGGSLFETMMHGGKLTKLTYKEVKEFADHYIDADMPLDDLVHDFLVCFVLENNFKLSMAGAARKLGLSGGETLKRLLERHGLRLYTKSEDLLGLYKVKKFD